MMVVTMVKMVTVAQIVSISERSDQEALPSRQTRSMEEPIQRPILLAIKSTISQIQS